MNFVGVYWFVVLTYIIVSQLVMSAVVRLGRRTRDSVIKLYAREKDKYSNRQAANRQPKAVKKYYPILCNVKSYGIDTVQRGSQSRIDMNTKNCTLTSKKCVVEYKNK